MKDIVNITEQNDIYRGTVATTMKIDGVSYRVEYAGEMNGCNTDEGSWSISPRKVNGKDIDPEKMERRVYWLIYSKCQLDFIDRIIPPHDFARREEL